MKDRAEQERKQRERASRRLVKLSTAQRKQELKDGREEMREESKAIREILRTQLTELGGETAKCDCERCSPPVYPAAPAPRRLWLPGKGFAGSLREESSREGRVSFRELYSRATRAARQAMRDKVWSDEDRADVVSSIVEGVLSKAAETVGGSDSKLEDIPAPLCSGTALYRRAKDGREVKVTQVQRDLRLSSGFAAGLQNPDGERLDTEAPDLARYPIAALRFAWSACDELGVPSTGDTFSIAYTVARLNGGVESVPVVAKELGVKAEKLRSLLKRAQRTYPVPSGEHRTHPSASYSLPKDAERERFYSGTTEYQAYNDRERVRGSMSPTIAAFMHELHILNNSEAGSRIARGASDLPEQWRGYDTKGPVYSVTHKHCRKRLSIHRPEWAQALSPRQAEALRAASVERRKRASLPTDSLERLAA